MSNLARGQYFIGAVSRLRCSAAILLRLCGEPGQLEEHHRHETFVSVNESFVQTLECFLHLQELIQSQRNKKSRLG